ncbi:PEP-CTERM sorting domain-containing protein [Aliiglaciecola sp. LCG003]|uniref:PEP-CTERM sorting domain-containing protein n=1 Tax=Aliiglaciecola sp. LCG003 TaxID=3053655 RepID=UPI002572E1A5|nr:PEP-CTERM sorting domain-containing protein [Aliiglaciecola sp. LCG003]WJG10952.1 PEP-CTERM sorting domain-containing protein [Aliiglaciecola sp. LCG003]
MKSTFFKTTLVGLMFCLGNSANAALITTDVGYSGMGLNLTAYQNGSYNFTFGPEVLPGGITFTAAPGGGGNSGSGSVIGQGGYGLGANGSFGGDAVYIGVDSATGYADLSFDSAVSTFGAYINYCPSCNGDNPFIAALDEFDNVVETWDLSVSAAISTPGGFNDFRFRGIDLGASSFSKFRFGGNYILLAASPDGDPIGQTPIPEPSTLAIFVLGIMGLASRRFNKQ